MKFKVGNANIDMTYLQGKISTSYYDLVACFGEPTSTGDNHKTDADWELTFEDGTVATIYNWKNGYNYLGSEGMDVKDITDWHIGGHTHLAETYVKQAMEEYLARTCFRESPLLTDNLID